MEVDVSYAMDKFYELIKSLPSTDAGESLTRFASTMPINVAIPALAHLCVILSAQIKVKYK